MPKHKRSTFRRSRRGQWTQTRSKIDKHMLARKGLRNPSPGEA